MHFTLENIQKYLEIKDHHLDYQKETGQLYKLITAGHMSFPFFIRLYEHNQLLQLIAFMPFPLSEGHEGDVARLLHFINKDIDMPGFGLDETNKIIFYRLMLPIHKLHLEEDTLDQLMNIFPNVCQTFSPPIMAVAQGKESLKTVLKTLNKLKQPPA